jgi:hypothetical protein
MKPYESSLALADAMTSGKLKEIVFKPKDNLMTGTFTQFVQPFGHNTTNCHYGKDAIIESVVLYPYTRELYYVVYNDNTNTSTMGQIKRDNMKAFLSAAIVDCEYLIIDYTG